MSKKAKKTDRSRKRNKTIIEGLKCEVNNWRSLAESKESHAAENFKELKAAEKRSDELSTMNRSLIDQKGRSFETISALKLIIAGLERDVAERDGTVRELRRQIDQAAPKVMVKPAVWVSPQEAGNHPLVVGGASIERFGEALHPSSHKKHWTAL